MVTHTPHRIALRTQRGTLMTELLVALSIVTLAVFPLALSFLNEHKLCRAYYYRALAMEIVDGEMEVLAAGEWQAFEAGSRPYQPLATAVTNLPPGQFELTISNQTLCLAWMPTRHDSGGAVVREVTLESLTGETCSQQVKFVCCVEGVKDSIERGAGGESSDGAEPFMKLKTAPGLRRASLE